MTEYYIQNGYVGNSVLWWAEHSKGYTTEIDKAGRYTAEQAKGIILRPQDRAWECKYIDENIQAHKIIIDAQYLNKAHCMEGNTK